MNQRKGFFFPLILGVFIKTANQNINMLKSIK